jgi:hypothetical protein
MYKTKVYSYLKSRKKADNSSQLCVEVKLSKSKFLISRFTWCPKLNGKGLFLRGDQLAAGGVIVNHEHSIVINYLLEFIEQRIERWAKTHDPKILGDFKNHVQANIQSEIDLEFLQFIKERNQKNEQFVTYNRKYNDITLGEPSLVRLRKQAFDEVDKILEQRDEEDGSAIIASEEDYEEYLLRGNRELENQEGKSLPTKERYEQGFFNRTNIFEIFGSTLYNESISPTYQKVIISLYRFKCRANPKQHIRAVNELWVRTWLKDLVENGYEKVSTKAFDPLNFNPSFFPQKENRAYKPISIEKMFEMFKALYRKLKDKYHLRQIDFSSINLKEEFGLKVKAKSDRIDFTLEFDEFHKLFDFNIQSVELSKYEGIFRQKTNNSFTFPLRYEYLIIARDLFILQTMAGGLRGFDELMTLEFQKASSTLMFKSHKTDIIIQNPLNCYTEGIAIKYNYQLPRLPMKRTDNSLKSIYRGLVKSVIEVMNFDRIIVNGASASSLKNIFQVYFARKTFGHILYHSFKIHVEDISLFTGHEMPSSVLTSNYINTGGLARKKLLSEQIQFWNSQGMASM